MEFGNGLGMREDEYSKDGHIEELVIAGPKPHTHTHRTSKDNVVCKEEGNTIDRANENFSEFW